MAKRTFKWYHYLMWSYQIQTAIVVAFALLALVQLAFYDSLEEDIVVFNEACEVTVGPVDEEGEVRQGATMMCGEDKVNLGALESKYLYRTLTEESKPVIICTKTQSEYLKEINWSCDFEDNLETETEKV